MRISSIGSVKFSYELLKRIIDLRENVVHMSNDINQKIGLFRFSYSFRNIFCAFSKKF